MLPAEGSSKDRQTGRQEGKQIGEGGGSKYFNCVERRSVF